MKKDICRNPTASSLFAATFDNALPNPTGPFNIQSSHNNVVVPVPDWQIWLNKKYTYIYTYNREREKQIMPH